MSVTFGRWKGRGQGKGRTNLDCRMGAGSIRSGQEQVRGGCLEEGEAEIGPETGPAMETATERRGCFQSNNHNLDLQKRTLLRVKGWSLPPLSDIQW